MVYLHADIACRMRPAEIVLLNPLYLLQYPFRRVGVESQMHGTGRQFRKHGKAEVQIVQLLLEREIHVGRQRSAVETRYEYGLGRTLRIGYDSVGTLNDHRPKARRKQRRGNVLPRGRLDRRHIERLVRLLRLGSDHDVEYPPLLSSVDGRHAAADRRGEQHLRTILVEKQRSPGLHRVIHSHEQFRRNAEKVVRPHGIGMHQGQTLQLPARLALEPYVETLFQFDDLRHTV